MAKRLRLKLNPKSIKGNKDGMNIFDMGTLLQFETHAWQARKRLPTKIAKKLTPKAEKTLVRANKDLIDKSHLSNINMIISDARAYVERITNPFPIKGIHFINNDLVERAKEKLNGYQIKLKKEVNKFVKQYKLFISEAEKELGADNLFNPLDYPPASNLYHRFAINYRLFDLTIPKHINEEMRKEETENFQDLIKQTKEMGILALREGFAEIVTNLTNTLTGKVNGEKKRLHQKSIDKISEFFNNFQEKKIFQDTDLENIVKDALLIVEDLDSNELRNDDDLTKLINSQLLNVKKEIDSSVTTFKRKVSFI